MKKRRLTRTIRIGHIRVGGSHPIAIQSMTTTDTRDSLATIAQIKKLEAAGCEIVRVAVPDEQAALALGTIKKAIDIPLVADIHFDYRLALLAMAQGVDKLRINPGNIGAKIGEIVAMARERAIPIRIGVNGGSLEKEMLEKNIGLAQGMLASAEKHIQILEDLNFDQILVSLKASDVRLSIEAYQAFSEKYDYPLHLGITEAGLPRSATVKSAIGLGYLLLNGIGDTLRISITGDPLDEVAVAQELLASIGLESRKRVKIIACPTCGRTEIDLIKIATAVDAALRNVEKDISVAVMGCIVNGVGEGKQADIGIAGGKNKAVLFKKGEIIRTIGEADIVSELLLEIEKM